MLNLVESLSPVQIFYMEPEWAYKTYSGGTWKMDCPIKGVDVNGKPVDMVIAPENLRIYYDGMRKHFPCLFMMPL